MAMTIKDVPRLGSRLGAALYGVGRFYYHFVRLLLTFLGGMVLLLLGILFVNYVVLSTPKDVAYRDLDPGADVCAAGLATGWTVLADTGRAALATTTPVDDDGWLDPSNDERLAVARDRSWATALRCSSQRHVVPATLPGGRPVDYVLSFLEFQEDGSPYALLSRDAGRDAPMTSAMLRHAMEGEMHSRHLAATSVRPVITQLDALKARLASGSNYVVVFIHGWRHDARVGDQNVADLRLYAAHAARFLAQRCPADPKACAMKVTAVYVGWRGARVDEDGLKRDFGETLGGALGTLSAAVTLFDRKPVSETVAPGAVSALRTIEGVLAARPEAGNKMIVFGHSLGGNMLATGLQDDIVKAVTRHAPGSTMPPALGDLVVLINPASEAAKWTSFQRAVWHRDAGRSGPDLFPADQKPVVVAVTAAQAFPPGGLRPGDCAWIGLDFDDSFRQARERIRTRLARSDTMFDAGIDYDWATHDLFPAFKFDFRPAAAYLERAAARIEGRQPDGQSCAAPPTVGVLTRLRSLPARTLALLVSTFPFQASGLEASRTIGNLDPPRPAEGILADAPPSAAPFGTTHELLGLHDGTGMERHHPYATLADAALDCPVTDGWLARARRMRSDQGGSRWDSADLAPAPPGSLGDRAPAARFVHGFDLSGTAPITRANDPFWNMRAFDDALSRHDGYRLSSFICAMNQLVLDDPTASPRATTPVAREDVRTRQP